MTWPPFSHLLWAHGETEVDQARRQGKAERTRRGRVRQKVQGQICLDWSARRGLAHHR